MCAEQRGDGQVAAAPEAEIIVMRCVPLHFDPKLHGRSSDLMEALQITVMKPLTECGKRQKRRGFCMKQDINYTMLFDFYELTMGNGYFQTGLKDRIRYFDVFFSAACPTAADLPLRRGWKRWCAISAAAF